MNTSTKYKLSSILLLGTILIGYNQCVMPKASSQKSTAKVANKSTSSVTVNTVPASNSNTTANTTATAARTVSIDAFNKTIYPIMKARCISCHVSSQTPLLASSSIDTAYDSIINGAKVDFTNTANSRLVLKLKNENHNCWGTCAASANEVLTQINAWKSLTTGTAADVVSTTVGGKTTRETSTIGMALNADNNANAGTVTLMGEAFSLKAPMVTGMEAGVSYVWAPTSTSAFDLTSTAAGNAIMTFSVGTSDFYKVYMYVNAPSATSSSMYVKLAGSDYKEWSMDTTTGFQWQELTNTPQKLDTEFYLTASKKYQLELRQKDSGVKVSKVVVTNDPDYNPNALARVSQKATLTVPLADMIGVADAYLDIDVEEYDLYSYKITNPRVRSSKDIKFKKMKILVNGVFNPQHATYLTVDKTITKSDSILSPYSMVMLKDKGAEFDKLSFSFDVIEAVK